MPISDAYTDAATYRAIIKMTDTTQDANILNALKAISRYVDRECDRVLTGFAQDAGSTTRIFWPKSSDSGNPEAENPWRGLSRSRFLELDEMAAVPTSVVIDTNRAGTFAGYTPLTNPTDSSGLVGGDYQCFPKNADKGPEPKPWTQLFIPTWSKQSGWWPGCMVQVTSIWGYPAIPAAISQAVIQLAAILRIEGPRATMQVAEGVDAAVQASPAASAIVMKLVKAYRHERAYT